MSTSADSNDIEEGLKFQPKFDASGLVTCVATDAGSGDVLMVAHMNDEALRKTIASGEAWYFSRSRQSLWRKGESSGHTQRVVETAAGLRSGRDLDPGRAVGCGLPHRPALVLLPRRDGGRGRGSDCRSSMPTGCSIPPRSIANSFNIRLKGHTGLRCLRLRDMRRLRYRRVGPLR